MATYYLFFEDERESEDRRFLLEQVVERSRVGAPGEGKIRASVDLEFKKSFKKRKGFLMSLKNKTLFERLCKIYPKIESGRLDK